MSSFDAELLARQLSQLGRDLDSEVAVLGELEEQAADAEGAYRAMKAAYDDCVDRTFLNAEGIADVRKAEARLLCVSQRALMHEANLEWDRAKGRVFTQQANLQALHKRCEIGRSLLSREKSLLSLAGIGET